MSAKVQRSFQTKLLAIASSAAITLERVSGQPRWPLNSQRIAMSTATPDNPTAANFGKRAGSRERHRLDRCCRNSM
jgi:hypothetical protein